MTESPRHENSVGRIKALARKLGAQVLENDDKRGKGGYKFEAIWSEKHQQYIQYTADCLARMPGGAMVDFEVNFKYHNNLTNDSYRAAQLAMWFITVVPVTPGEVDLWEKDPDLLEAEVEYRQKRTFGIAPEIQK